MDICRAPAVGERRPDLLMVLSDIQPDVIMMYQAYQQGWRPPIAVTEEEYAIFHHAPPSPIRAFIGHGCSFGAKFFGGYAREGRRGQANYAAESARLLNKKMAHLGKALFIARPYTRMNYIPGSIIYCDPPYIGTTEYSGQANFNSKAFWDWARKYSEESVVLISETQAPSDFEAIWEMEYTPGIRSHSGGKRIEKLFKRKTGDL